MKEMSVSPCQWCLCWTDFGAGDAGERWKGRRRDSHLPNQSKGNNWAHALVLLTLDLQQALLQLHKLITFINRKEKWVKRVAF